MPTPPRTSELVTVVPSPALSSTEYVPGVPAEGLTLTREEAQPMLDAGIAVLKPAPAKKETD